MTSLPTGTVTMLFTDIEGSTRLLQELGRERYAEALRAHRDVLRSEAARRGGVEVEMQGDSFHFAFAEAPAAVAAAAEMQRALRSHEWPDSPVRVRIGVHTGEPAVDGDLYVGLDVHRAARVMAAGHGGQIVVSAAARDAAGDLGADGLSFRDLGAHRLKDLLEPQRLYQLLGDGLATQFPPLSVLPAAVELPVPPNRLIGREQELDGIERLLDAGTRLLTLVGPGGTGKTRLALQAAANLADRFPDGVWFVALAPLRDERLVLAEIARVVGHREQAGQELADSLAAELSGKHGLLLLDNVEHVVGSAASVAALLARAPRLVVLATSREPLHVRGEHLLHVEPLPIETDASLLFAERARAVSGTFALAGENVEHVAAICRRLDGLPLALELAAARTATLSPRALLGRLHESLGLLTEGPRDADERQRTLRATIDWSYELLTGPEQELFLRLSAFAGGGRLDAVSAVSARDPLDDLASLVDRSLVRRSDDPDGEPRFWLLETMREYATERAGSGGLRDESRRRHAEWYADVALGAELGGPAHAEWLDRLLRENDNLRVGLGWLIEAGDGEQALRLAVALSRIWLVRGSLREARGWLEAALARDGEFPARSSALRRLAIHALDAGELDAAAAAADEALARDRASGDAAGAGQSAGILGDVAAHRGDFDAAGRMYEEAAEQARAFGDDRELGVTLYNLANVRHHQGADDEAGELFADALGVFERLGDELGQGGVHMSMADLALARGALDEVSAHVTRSAELLTAIGYGGGLADVVETAANVASAAGRADAAARLYGASHGQREALGRAGVHPAEAAGHDEGVAAARTEVGEEAFDAAWAEGAALTQPDAVTLAVETVRSVATAQARPVAS